MGFRLTMMRFLVVYPTPIDVEQFDRHYFQVHVPIVKRFAKLRAYTVSRDLSAIRGHAGYHFVAELDWDDIESLRHDFESEVGREAARDAATLAELSPGMHSMTYELLSI
jgi:uncharacterized protein (TIGR02118 family)